MQDSLGNSIACNDCVSFESSQPVPEPSTLALLGIGGLAGLTFAGIRRRRGQT
jgi:hypothetical protein